MTPAPAIYLDHAATTPLDERVLDAMLPYLRHHYGNPSSVHAAGRKAKAAVEEARAEVAALINAKPGEIIFTSGGTESDNAAIRFALETAGEGARDIITSPAEHPAVLAACAHEKRNGAVVYELPVNHAAVPDLASIEARIAPSTALCSLMHVNNETGGILPLDATGELLRKHNVLFHCDAVQSTGKLPIDVTETNVDLLSMSAHKIHGPKGIGALYVRSGPRMTPLQFGGAQERGRRGGTENVPAIIGFGEAAKWARLEMEQRYRHCAGLRAMAEDMLCSSFAGIHFNGTGKEVIPNILSVTFPAETCALDGAMLVMRCDIEGLMISSGSACSAGSIEASHVIRAIGRDDAETAATIRISFTAETMEEELRRGMDILIRVVQGMSGRSRPCSHSRMTIP